MDTIPRNGVGKKSAGRKSSQIAKIAQNSRWPWNHLPVEIEDSGHLPIFRAKLVYHFMCAFTAKKTSVRTGGVRQMIGAAKLRYGKENGQESDQVLLGNSFGPGWPAK
jgi:hypothetical protein